MQSEGLDRGVVTLRLIFIYYFSMKQVNITIGRFQPFTNGHMACIEEVYKKLGIPTIICMIGVPEAKVDEKHPFTSDILVPMYKEVFERSKMVEDVVLVKNANIVDIGEMLHEMGYEIRSWSCGSDRIEAYEKMSSKYHDEAHLSEDFEMFEIKRSDEDVSATKVRQALIDNDYRKFAAMTPLATLKSKLTGKNYYDILRNQILKVYEIS